MNRSSNRKAGQVKGAVIGSAASLLIAVSSPSILAQEVEAAVDSQQNQGEEIVEVRGVRFALEDFAGGQSIATPSRSAGAVGDSNPFGAFEAGIFDGVEVVKSPTADMQAGAVAGIVNLKFQKALSKKDGDLRFDLGTRFEELSDQYNPTFRVQASKHLIDDKLAIAFKVAGSGQDFRRDTVNFTQYTNLAVLNSDGEAIRAAPVISDEALDAYRAQYGLEDNSQIRVITRAGQAAEVRGGDRYSGAFNVEFQATDNIKLGADYLKTRRTLDQSNLEDVQFVMRRQADNEQQQVTLLGAPSSAGFAAPGEPPTYTVGHARINNSECRVY